MKKAVSVLGFILVMSITVWAGGDHDGNGRIPKPKKIGSEISMKAGVNYQIECISISTNTPGVYAANLEMTDQYQKYQKILVFNVQKTERSLAGTQIQMIRNNDGSVFHVAGQTGVEIGEIYPLLNLDLYGKEPNGKKISIQDLDAEVTVFISYQQLKDFKVDLNEVKTNIFVFIREENQWVPLSDERSGVSRGGFHQTRDGIEFVITEWPVDDKMIGSGH